MKVSRIRLNMNWRTDLASRCIRRRARRELTCDCMLLHVSQASQCGMLRKDREAKLKLLNISNDTAKARFATTAHEYEIYD